MKIIISVAAGALVIAAAATFLLLRTDTESPAETPVSNIAAAADEVVPTIPETKQIAADWRGYENVAFRFALLYPQELRVREYKEREGAMSAIFENPSNGQGFQIYVTPYGDTQITKERFLLDISSGVMKDPTDIVVGGVRGTMFFSTNSIMGETREVWFINNGFLYEVVTYKQLDAWLASIMQTWKFL